MKFFNYAEPLWRKLLRLAAAPSELPAKIRRRWPWRFARSAFPRSVAIEVTNRCNLRCVMCHREAMTRPTGLMTAETFKSAADQAIAGGATTIVPFNYGEPLLHPSLPDWIRYVKASAPHVCVKLNTNGMLLTPDTGAALLDAELDEITISLEGATAEQHERFAVGASYARVTENLHRFIAQRDEQRRATAVRICLVRMEGTHEAIDEFVLRWRTIVDSITIHDVNTGAGRLVDRRVEKRPLVRRHPCRELWGKLVVLWNGDVTVCCIDFDGKLVAGSLAAGDRLKDIWSNPRLENLRRRHRDRSFTGLPLCEHCDSDDVL